MELRHVRYFIAVAEELNFTRAAARLGIGQPPLSQQIKDLEANLGVVLFRRVPHGAELTEAGRTFLHESRLALTAFEKAAIGAKRAARGELGILRMGFTGSAHFHPQVPAVIREFGVRYPGVVLELVEANTSRLLELLSLGSLDAAFGHSRPAADRRFNSFSVATEQLVVALPTSHRLAGQQQIHLRDLASDSFVIKSQNVGPEMYAAVLGACRRAGFDPQMGQTAPQLATVISFVAANLGVSLVPESMQQIQAHGVIYAPLQDNLAQVKLIMTWRRTEFSQTVLNFVSLVKEASGAATPNLPNQIPPSVDEA